MASHAAARENAASLVACSPAGPRPLRRAGTRQIPPAVVPPRAPNPGTEPPFDSCVSTTLETWRDVSAAAFVVPDSRDKKQDMETEQVNQEISRFQFIA